MELNLWKFVLVVGLCLFKGATSSYVSPRDLWISDDEESMTTMTGSSGSGSGSGFGSTDPEPVPDPDPVPDHEQVCRPCECQCQCDYPPDKAQADLKALSHVRKQLDGIQDTLTKQSTSLYSIEKQVGFVQHDLESPRNPLCPDDFLFDRQTNMCFKLQVNKLTWAEAQRDCQHMGPMTHLAVIDTADKLEMITEHIKQVDDLPPTSDKSTNLASGKPTFQSSIYNSLYKSALAVDGNADPDWRRGSCTHTERDALAWWAVDLGDIYHVTSVRITNRGDCTGNCARRLRDFNIALTSSSPSEVTPTPESYDVIYHQTEAMGAGLTVDFASRDETISGRYLVIQLLGMPEWLTLCEVQVFGYRREVSIHAGGSIGGWDEQVWLGGMKDKKEAQSQWYWTTTGRPFTEKTTALWGPEEPNNYLGNDEDCLAMAFGNPFTTWRLNDNPCSDKMLYLCEHQLNN